MAKDKELRSYQKRYVGKTPTSVDPTTAAPIVDSSMSTEMPTGRTFGTSKKIRDGDPEPDANDPAPIGVPMDLGKVSPYDRGLVNRVTEPYGGVIDDNTTTGEKMGGFWGGALDLADDFFPDDLGGLIAGDSEQWVRVPYLTDAYKHTLGGGLAFSMEKAGAGLNALTWTADQVNAGLAWGMTALPGGPRTMDLELEPNNWGGLNTVGEGAEISAGQAAMAVYGSLFRAIGTSNLGEVYKKTGGRFSEFIPESQSDGNFDDATEQFIEEYAFFASEDFDLYNEEDRKKAFEDQNLGKYLSGVQDASVAVVGDPLFFLSKPFKVLAFGGRIGNKPVGGYLNQNLETKVAKNNFIEDMEKGLDLHFVEGTESTASFREIVEFVDASPRDLSRAKKGNILIKYTDNPGAMKSIKQALSEDRDEALAEMVSVVKILLQDETGLLTLQGGKNPHLLDVVARELNDGVSYFQATRPIDDFGLKLGNDLIADARSILDDMYPVETRPQSPFIPKPPAPKPLVGGATLRSGGTRSDTAAKLKVNARQGFAESDARPTRRQKRIDPEAARLREATVETYESEGFIWNIVKATAASRPIALVRWGNKGLPTGIIHLKGGDGVNSDLEFANWLRETELTPAQQSEFLAKWADSSMSPAAKRNILIEAEKATITAIGKRLGKDYKETMEIYESYNGARWKALSDQLDPEQGGKGFSVAEDNETLIKAADMYSVLDEQFPMLDVREFRNVVSNIGDMGTIIGVAKNTGAKAADILNNGWKVSVLLRFGYTARNLTEGALRSVATMGFMATNPEFLSRIPASVTYQAYKAYYGRNARAQASAVQNAMKQNAEALDALKMFGEEDKLSDIARLEEALLEEQARLARLIEADDAAVARQAEDSFNKEYGFVKSTIKGGDDTERPSFVFGNHDEVLFVGIDETFDTATTRPVTQVQATPAGILEEAVRRNPNDQKLQSILTNIKNNEFGEDEVKLLDSIIAALAVDDAGKISQVEQTSGFALVLSSLSGNKKARKTLNKKLEAFYDNVEKTRQEKVLDNIKNAGTPKAEPIQYDEIAFVRSSEYPFVKDAEGNVYLEPAGKYREDVPRSTIHFTINGEVKSHLMGKWDETNQLVVVNGGNATKANNNPASLNPADSWWSVSPGQKLELPNASVISPYIDEAKYVTELEKRGLLKPGENPPVVVEDLKTNDVFYFSKSADEYTDADRIQILEATGKSSDKYSVAELVGKESETLRRHALDLAMRQQKVSSGVKRYDERSMLFDTELVDAIRARGIQDGIYSGSHDWSESGRLEQGVNRIFRMNDGTISNRFVGSEIEGYRWIAAQGLVKTETKSPSGVGSRLADNLDLTSTGVVDEAPTAVAAGSDPSNIPTIEPAIALKPANGPIEIGPTKSEIKLKELKEKISSLEAEKSKIFEQNKKDLNETGRRTPGYNKTLEALEKKLETAKKRSKALTTYNLKDPKGRSIIVLEQVAARAKIAKQRAREYKAEKKLVEGYNRDARKVYEKNIEDIKTEIINRKKGIDEAVVGVDEAQMQLDDAKSLFDDSLPELENLKATRALLAKKLFDEAEMLKKILAQIEGKGNWKYFGRQKIGTGGNVVGRDENGNDIVWDAAFDGSDGQMARILSSADSTYQEVFKTGFLSKMNRDRKLGEYDVMDPYKIGDGPESSKKWNQYWNNYLDRINRRYKQDKIVSRWLTYGDDERDMVAKATDWVMGSSQQNYRSNFGLNDASGKADPAKVRAHIDMMYKNYSKELPIGSGLRETLNSSPKGVTKEQLLSSLGDSELPVIPVLREGKEHTGLLKHATRDDAGKIRPFASTGGAVGSVVSGLMKVLGSIPETKLLRHPYYAAVYRKEQLRMANMAKADGKSISDARIRDRINSTAHRYALQQTRKTLYTIERQTSGSQALRFFFPFFPAWSNTLRTWSGIAYQNPAIVAYANAMWNIPNSLGWVVDGDGNKVEFSNMFSSDEDTFIIQPESLLKATLALRKIPVAGYLASKTPVLNTMIPVMDEDGNAIPVATRQSGLNVVFTGGIMDPGVGPLTPIATGLILRGKPELTEVLRKSMGDDMFRRIVANGDPNTPIKDIVLPTFIKRAYAKMFAGENENTAFLRLQNTMTQDAIITAAAVGKVLTQEDFEKVIRNADALWNWTIDQSLTAFTASTSYRSPYTVERKIWRDLLDNTSLVYSKKIDKFMNKMGELHPDQDPMTYFGLTGSTSESAFKVNSNQQSYDRLTKNPKIVEGIADDLGKEFVGQFTGIGDQSEPFSYSVYGELQNHSIGNDLVKEKMTAEELFKKDQISKGWQEFFLAIDSFDDQAKSVGLESYKDLGDDVIDAVEDYKQSLGEKYPAYGNVIRIDYDISTTSKRLEVARITVESASVKDRRKIPTIGVLEEYLQGRDVIISLLDDVDGLDMQVTKKAELKKEIRKQGYLFAGTLRNKDIGFSEYYDRYFSNDTF